MSDPEYSSDPWLDARLRNVPLPVNFLARLEQIGNAETQQMDRALRDVPVPAGLQDRLRLIALEPQHSLRPRLRTFAMAASVLLALGLGYAGWRSQQQPANPPDQGDVAQGSLKTPGEEGPLPSVPTQLAQDDAIDTPFQPEPGMDPNEVINPESNDFDRWPSPTDFVFDPHFPAPAVPGPADAPATTPAAAENHRPLGASGQLESLPDLDFIDVRVPRGITPPRVPGYDLLFQLKHGQHPFVSPAVKELSSVQVPLVTSTAGYRRAWRWVNGGRLPVADDLRTEEFLAALKNQFPPAPAGSVAIQVAGGPAPLREAGVSLLQVVVEAGGLPAENHPATHLTIVLDTSEGMHRAERWTAVQKALDGLRSAMSPHDRVSVISYNDNAELLVDSVDRDGIGLLTSALQNLTPRRAANLAAGLTLACTQTPAAAKPVAAVRAVLVISGGRVDSDKQAAEQARERAAALVKTGATLQVVDLSRDEAGGGNLAVWTQATAGRLIRVADPGALPWHLLEALIGRSSIVAAQTSLKVSFKPEAVAAYRLLGHERTTITGPSLAQTVVDLRCGESAGALFEVWLKPGVNSDVGTAEVIWHKSEHSPELRVTQRLSREQFAATFADSAPALQAAAVAALTTETLRGSYFAPASRSLARVLELAKQAAPVLQSDVSFRELVAFIQQAERVRTHGAGSRHVAPAPAGR